MEEKKVSMGKFVIPVVAVTVFMLALFAAGYAFFAANLTGAENLANISAQLPSASTTLVTTGNTCTMSVDASNMVEAKNNTTEAVHDADCYLSLVLSGAANVKCTYDVYLEETSTTGSSYQITNISANTPYDGFEFTGTITYEAGSCSDGSSLNSDACEDESGTWTDAEGDNDSDLSVNAETQMDELVTLNNDPDRPGLIAHGTIETDDEGNTVYHYYKMVEKWYNIPYDQSEFHDNALYTFELKVQNIEC